MTEVGIIEAVVQVGAQETHYLRCGRGDQVVVVLTDDASERLRLIRHYAGSGRVTAPVPPLLVGTPRVVAGGAADPPEDAGRSPGGMVRRAGDGRAAADWIIGVIDGLGLDRPAVVLAADVAWLAVWLVDGSGEAFELMEAVALPSR